MAAEVRTQLAEHPLTSPKAKLKPEKKSGHRPESHGDSGPQKAQAPPPPETCDPYPRSHWEARLCREGRVLSDPLALVYPLTPLSDGDAHHLYTHRGPTVQSEPLALFCPGSRYLKEVKLYQTVCIQTQASTNMLTSMSQQRPRKDINTTPFRKPWKRELKELTSRVAVFTKETELKNKEKEEPPRERGAKYSAETGRLIPVSTQALSRRSFHQRQRSHSSNRDGGAQASLLQDQELLILELLCQILQTDSLSAIQLWLLYAPLQEKDLALGLLQTAVAQLLPRPLDSIPAETLLDQLQEVQEPPQEKPQPPYSQSLKKAKSPPLPQSEKPVYIGKAQVLKVHSGKDEEEKASKPKSES
ncbi:protein TBATA isoform X2 [Heterocephalus glaber]|uniref:Protein TBATA isoform X2 n=1 Tax=Heterocephalus glaber TaxID=10181 RepID=A0AAX6T1B6_HETGA|nr:protein TBATA isoform X2 [Heterocephalus glaber]